MSILASILFAQAAAAAPVPPPPLPTFDAPPSETVAEEIVVIARKMKTWKGGIAGDNGQLACRTHVSTGDADIDAVRCGAMLRCFAPEEPEFSRIAELDLPADERNRMLQAHAATLTPCLEAAEEAGMRFLAESRAEAE